MPWKRTHNEIGIFSKEMSETKIYWVLMITLHVCVYVFTLAMYFGFINH